MQPFRYHVFICDQQKPEGAPCCAARGSGEVIAALRKEIAASGLGNKVQVTTCGSLGLCERGPNLVVYPEGVWYSGVRAEDVPELVRSHFRAGRVVERLAAHDEVALRQEIQATRDKALAALRAKDAAGALPDDLAERMRAFQESRVILTAVELDVFTAVGRGATAEEVSRQIGANARATEMLLNALVAIGLLTKRDGVFHTSGASERYLAAGSPDDSRAATMHTAHLWSRWSTLTECVRAGTSVSRQEPGARPDDWTRAFIAAMHRNARERAPLVVCGVATEGLARMLDVGGGSGAYSIAFAKAHERLEVELLDLAEVLPIAEGHIQQAGLSGRVKTRPGDLRTDALGSAFDLVFVSAICHMLNPEENRDLLRRGYAALAPNGRLVIQEFILEADKTAPKTAALFALNMLVGTRGGSTYSAPEYLAWMGEAGFQDVRHIRLPGPTGLIVGTRR